MRPKHGALLLALVVVFAAAVPAFAADASPPMVRLAQLAPQLPAGATALGRMSSQQSLSISVLLQPSHPDQLDSFLRDLYDPASPRYQHWLTTGEFAQQFGPSPDEIAQVTDWLHAQGLTRTRVSNMAVQATGPAGTIGRALGVSFAQYRLAGGETGYAASAAPLVPPAVAPEVATILGLSDTLRFQPAIDRAPGHLRALGHTVAAPAGFAQSAAAPSACPQARAFAGNVYWTADEVGRLYHVNDLFSAGLTGRGKTIALLELGRSRASDVNAYASCFRLRNTVKVKHIDGGAAVDPDASLEANIDIQEAATQAPDATIISYEAPNTSQGEFDAYNAIVGDNTAQVVSTSWGKCEALLEAEPGGSIFIDALDTLFKQAAAQGQTVFAAAGDTGSVDCYDGTTTPPSDTLQVDNPADDPFVTGVGGTALEQPGVEPVWNDCEGLAGNSCAVGGMKAAGGGLSGHFARPSWQRLASNATCTVCREVPDISANAGVGEVFYDSGTTPPPSWTAVGGTSIAAPLMAGILADVTQGCRGGRVGNFAPKLNALANLGVYTTGLIDITRGINWSTSTIETPGNNDLTHTHGGAYKTTKGFDLASGFGRPIASGLACPQINSVSPSQGTARSFAIVHGVGLERATIKFGGKVASVVTAGPLKAIVITPTLRGTVSVTASDPIGTGGGHVLFSYPGADSGRYRTAASDGSVYNFGGAPKYGAPNPSSVHAPIVGMAVDRATGGYWLAAADGSVYNFHAPFYGSAAGHPLNQPIVGIAATPKGDGYWLVARDGGIFAFGKARFYGSTGGMHLNQPIVGIAVAPRTGGYWLVASDGGIFAFNAPFHGSTGGMHLNQPIVGIAADRATGGYWLVASDGGVFAFQAPFYGSTGNIRLNKPIVGMSPSDDARGYRFVASDGGVFTFGDARFSGSTGGLGGAPVVAIAPAH